MEPRRRRGRVSDTHLKWRQGGWVHAEKIALCIHLSRTTDNKARAGCSGHWELVALWSDGRQAGRTGHDETRHRPTPGTVPKRRRGCGACWHSSRSRRRRRHGDRAVPGAHEIGIHPQQSPCSSHLPTLTRTLEDDAQRFAPRCQQCGSRRRPR